MSNNFPTASTFVASQLVPPPAFQPTWGAEEKADALHQYLNSQFLALEEMQGSIESGWLIDTVRILNLEASTITSGSIFTQDLYIGDDQKIQLLGTTNRIEVYDEQGSPRLRVRIGDLGSGTTNWGIEAWDSGGSLRFSVGDSIFLDGAIILNSTIEWWMQQSEETRSVFNAENRVSLKDALHGLAYFIETKTGDAEVYVWGNGPAYDNAILANAFNATWIKQPWSFSKDTCVRTMVMLGRQLGIDPKYDLPMEGKHHNALDDAIHQARYVSTIWQALFAPHIAMPEEDCLECGGYGRVCTDADSIDEEETCEACHGSGAMKGSKAYEEHCNR